MLLVLKAENPYKPPARSITLDPKAQDRTEWIIGRLPECPIFLDEPEVSRDHAEIKAVDGNFYFIDRSSNGSFVNGVPIATNFKYLLNTGDQLGIGNTTLTVEEIELPPKNPIDVAPTVQYWTNQELQLRCFNVIRETPDTKTFEFVGEPSVLFFYFPGQFINLEFDINGQKVVRPYSISSSPSRPYSLSITVKRVPNGSVSNWINDHFSIGDTVKALPGGAKGKFTCLPNKSNGLAMMPPKLLLIGAGSGITPLFSMLTWIRDTGSQSITDIVLLYSAKTPDDIIFRDEIERMVSRMRMRARAIFTITKPEESALPWTGYTGRISSELIKLIAPDLLDRTVFVCGSTDFMQSTRSILEGLNLPMSQYYQESFGGKPTVAKMTPVVQTDSNPPLAEAAVATAATQEASKIEQVSNGKSVNSNFAAPPTVASAEPQISAAPQKESQNGRAATTVTTTPVVAFVQSGKEIEVDEDCTVLELATQADVLLQSGCGAGVCGTCKIKVSKGKVKHDPDPTDATLSSADRSAGYVLACTAYPQGPIEVEA